MEELDERNQNKHEWEIRGNNLLARFHHKIMSIVLSYPRLEGKAVTQIQWIENIPEWNVIFATTHLDDQDPWIVTKNIHDQHRDITIVSQASNFNNPVINFASKLAGKDRVLPLSNFNVRNPIHGSSWGYKLKGSDFDRIASVATKGKDIIIAWHRPTHDGNLPEKAGIWGVIISHLTWKALVPSVVHGRKLSYLSPLEISKLTDEQRNNLLSWSKWGCRLSKEVLEMLKSDAEKLLEVYTKFLIESPK